MTVECSYCGGTCRPRWKAASHPLWREMPQVDIHECTVCGSLTTHPLPSRELLSACYSKYGSGGIPEKKARAKRTTRQHLWYRRVLEAFEYGPSESGSVADVGAGEGFLERAIVETSGADTLECFDHHEAPDLVRQLVRENEGTSIAWHQVDFSAPGWAPPRRFDWVFCISVIEHVLDPKSFVKDLCSMGRMGGRVCIIGPCVDSWAYRILGKRWMYMIPGEHLTIPSLEGLRSMAKSLGLDSLRLRTIPVAYSLKYVVGGTLGWNIPGYLDVVVDLPVGAFAFEVSGGVDSGESRGPKDGQAA